MCCARSAGSITQLALVTGTTSGIGLSVARRLLDRGWQVIGMARRPAEIEHPQYRHLGIDLADLSHAASTVEQEVAPLVGDSRWQRVGLVNNAANPDLLTSVEQIDPVALLRVYAVNTAAPVWLMGFAIRRSPRTTILRIVNVSSGAAVGVFPGLAAYGSSKAALRMAGMVVAAELTSSQRRLPTPTDVAILSYEPGIVDTPMQRLAREQPSENFPSVQLFRDFAAYGVLVQPQAPAAEIVAFLESDDQPGFSERRFGTSGSPRARSEGEHDG
jgi:benzil reductase ((S)-benzoin forming)